MRCVANATAGAIAIMTNGKVAASVTSHVAARRPTVTRGEDRSTTGNSVQADIDHNDVSRTWVSTATIGGSTKVAQNATVASRRSGDVGQAMSSIAARVGRIKAKRMTSGTAT